MADKEKKPNVKLEDWEKDYFNEDIELNETIAQLAKKDLLEKFRMGFEEPISVIAFYAVTFDAILEELKDAQKDNKEYNISFVDRFDIGYTDCTDEDNEKVGSFNPYMYPVDTVLKDFIPDEDEKSIERNMRWNAENIHEQPKVIHDISVRATKMLAEKVDLHLPKSGECVIGPFCIIHDYIVKYLSEYFMQQYYNVEDVNTYRMMVNVMAGSYDMILSINENGKVEIQYKLNVSAKQSTKDDGVASGDRD